MKNHFSRKLILASASCILACLSFSFCTQNSKKNMNLAETGWKIENQALFKYKNTNEASTRIHPLINKIINEMRDELTSRTDVTNIITQIILSDGKAILHEIYVVNADTHEVVDGGI